MHKIAMHAYALCIKSGKKVHSFPVGRFWGERAVFVRVVCTNGKWKSGVFALVVMVMHMDVWIVEMIEDVLSCDEK